MYKKPASAYAYRDKYTGNKKSYTNSSDLWAGGAFLPPPGSEGVQGIASCSIEDSSEVDSTTGIVTIRNIAGILSAASGTQFGSAYRIVVWVTQNGADSILTRDKVLWEASVRIEGGSVITTGGFAPSDFMVFTDQPDSSGFLATTVIPKPELSLTIVSNATDADDVVLSDFGEVGYGVYNADFPFENPPVLTPIGNKTVSELTTLALTATATDPDAGSILTFSLDAGAPVGAAIDGSTGAFSWMPTEARGPGSYPITVFVTDNGTGPSSAFETITVTVNEVNVGPVVAPIGDQAAVTGVLLTFTAAATDADLPANTLTFSQVLGTPSATGAAITAAGVFTWTPTEAQTGNFPVTITVTDNGIPPLSASESFAVIVGDVTGVPSSGVPSYVTALMPTAPNPTSGIARLVFSLAERRQVVLDVFDIHGHLVRRIANEEFDAGWHAADWDLRNDSGRPVAGGVYVYRLLAGAESLSRKLMVTR